MSVMRFECFGKHLIEEEYLPSIIVEMRNDDNERCSMPICLSVVFITGLSGISFNYRVRDII